MKRSSESTKVVLLVGCLAMLGFAVAFMNFGSQSKSAGRRAAVAQVATLVRAVQTYRLNLGELPPDLDALFVRPPEFDDKDNWEPVLDAPVSPDPYGTPFRYTKTGSDFEVRSAGKDQAFFTADDIVKQSSDSAAQESSNMAVE